jgi:hypothetical protein
MRVRVLVVAAVAALVVPVARTAPALAVAGGGCTSTWSAVPAPVTSPTDDDVLLAVAAGGPGDVWAVGYQTPSGGGQDVRTLVLHWDGAAWSIVPSPSPSETFSVLHGVAVVGPGDVWAVGTYSATTSHPPRPLAMHWDGAGWTVAPVPVPTGAGSAALFAVAAEGDRVWAVGHHATETGADQQALTVRWDGTRWLVVPNPGGDPGVTRLAAVDVLPEARAVAVGVEGQINHGSAFAIAWNGRRWRDLDAAPPGYRGVTALDGVAARSPEDVWAVGWRRRDRVAMAEHFDGASWAVTPVPTPGVTSVLHAVAVTPGGEAEAVGSFVTEDGATRALAVRWDGSRWQASRGPVVRGATDDELFGLARAGDGTMWAAGYAIEDGFARPLVARRCEAGPSDGDA